MGHLVIRPKSILLGNTARIIAHDIAKLLEGYNYAPLHHQYHIVFVKCRLRVRGHSVNTRQTLSGIGCVCQCEFRGYIIEVENFYGGFQNLVNMGGGAKI